MMWCLVIRSNDTLSPEIGQLMIYIGHRFDPADRSIDATDDTDDTDRQMIQIDR